MRGGTAEATARRRQRGVEAGLCRNVGMKSE